MSSWDIDAYLDAAREYLKKRVLDRQLRCVAGKPYFTKNYRNSFTEKMRRLYILGAQGVDALSRGAIERKISIPDMIDRRGNVVNILKSVDSVGRVPLFARACPEDQFIYIVRHPCGVVGSKLRGKKLGKIGSATAYLDWLKFDYAVESKLTERDLNTWTGLETAAWGWTLFNDYVLRLADDLPNIHIVNYDRLCSIPMEGAKSIFQKSGLPWHPQTEKYINDCISNDPNTAAGYYSTQQNPKTAANRWRAELSDEEVAEILSVCENSPRCMAIFGTKQRL